MWSTSHIQLSTALFCDITQQVVVISYRHFGTTYQSHLQGSTSAKKKICAKQPLQFVDLWHSLEETDKSLEQPQSAQTVKWPRLKPNTHIKYNSHNNLLSELERTGEEDTVGHFKIVFHHLQGQVEETH